MVRKTFQLVLLCGFLAVVVWAYVQNENDIERIAMENGFDAEQTAAYRACDHDMSGKSLSLGGITYSKVPSEICVCQSREMVAVFRSGEYSSHQSVVDYLTEENTVRSINRTHLRNPANAEGEFARLVDSLRRCVVFFRLEHDRRNREALQNLCKELEMEGAARRPSQCADLASGRL